jgi:hypothetical protein
MAAGVSSGGTMKRVTEVYRLYASAHAKGLHILHDHLPPLAHAVDKFARNNKGMLIHSGRTIVGKCHERFYLMKTAAKAKKLANIMNNSIVQRISNV